MKGLEIPLIVRPKFPTRRVFTYSVIALVIFGLVQLVRYANVNVTEQEVRTVVELGDCTSNMASDGYFRVGMCRAIFNDGSRLTVERPVLIGDKLAFCRTVEKDHERKRTIRTYKWSLCS